MNEDKILDEIDIYLESVIEYYEQKYLESDKTEVQKMYFFGKKIACEVLQYKIDSMRYN